MMNMLFSFSMYSAKSLVEMFTRSNVFMTYDIPLETESVKQPYNYVTEIP